MLHEEMWDVNYDQDGWWFNMQELYQLWINLPAAHKMDHPAVYLLSNKDDDDDDDDGTNDVDGAANDSHGHDGLVMSFKWDTYMHQPSHQMIKVQSQEY